MALFAPICNRTSKGGCFFFGIVPRYSKPPLALIDQLAKLKARGLHVEDDQEALHDRRKPKYLSYFRRRLRTHRPHSKAIPATLREDLQQQVRAHAALPVAPAL